MFLPASASNKKVIKCSFSACEKRPKATKTVSNQSFEQRIWPSGIARWWQTGDAGDCDCITIRTKQQSSVLAPPQILLL